MVDQPGESLDLFVLHIIMGAFKSREVLEAEWPDDAPPLDEDRLLLDNWTSVVDRQGLVLSHLAAAPPTRAELKQGMPGMVNRAPAWMDARLHGEAMTWRLFMTGLAQTAAEHREAIERVIAEQVIDPEPIEEVLAESPVPPAHPDEDRSVLMSATGKALSAHTKALVEIAYDLETQIRHWVEGDDEELESDFGDEDD